MSWLKDLYFEFPKTTGTQIWQYLGLMLFPITAPIANLGAFTDDYLMYVYDLILWTHDGRKPVFETTRFGDYSVWTLPWLMIWKVIWFTIWYIGRLNFKILQICTE